VTVDSILKNNFLIFISAREVRRTKVAKWGRKERSRWRHHCLRPTRSRPRKYVFSIAQRSDDVGVGFAVSMPIDTQASTHTLTLLIAVTLHAEKGARCTCTHVCMPAFFHSHICGFANNVEYLCARRKPCRREQLCHRARWESIFRTQTRKFVTKLLLSSPSGFHARRILRMRCDASKTYVFPFIHVPKLPSQNDCC